mmetsp:Transcript_60798/g.141667  ORF Transcript_60798/g.141667 Transcript_60798/m.141667 type:complete len:207 (-) Transcript_60798:18-638(-)
MVQTLQALVDLHSSEAQRGANPCNRCHYREDVDGVAHPAKTLFPQHRIQAVADGHGKAATVGHDRKHSSHGGVGNPPVQPPMIPSNHERVGGVFVVVAVALGAGDEARIARALVVPHWLRNRVVEEANGHSCREKHGKPSGEAVLWLFAVLPQLHIAVLGVDHEEEEDYNPNVLGDDVEPSPNIRDPLKSHVVHGFLRLVRHHNAY